MIWEFGHPSIKEVIITSHIGQMETGINVLSPFDGISCGQIALERAGILVDNYFASEIDSNAIELTLKRYPKTIQLGDIRNVKAADLPRIDLIIGGSPCQGFSFAGSQLKFDDPRSQLFFEFVRLWEETGKPNFLLENIRMLQESRDVFSKHLGVEPIMINSALVSAQKRTRYYWTNIPDLKLPEDKSIILEDIVDYNNRDLRSLALTEYEIERAKLKHKGKTWKSGYRMGNMKFPNTTDKKSQCLPSLTIRGARETTHLMDNGVIRLLSIRECEKLQTLPVGYTDLIDQDKARSLIGNGWTVDIIVHIFKQMRLT